MRITKLYLTFITMIFALFSMGKVAYGQEQMRLLGKFGDWSAYSFVEDGGQVCFMSSSPIKDVGKYTKRGNIMAFVTHRPKQGTFDEFEIITGYDYKPNSMTTVSVNKQNFSLKTKDDYAVAETTELDKKIIAAVKSGNTMIVKGTSKRGTLTTDTYSLKGSGQAYKTISEACKAK